MTFEAFVLCCEETETLKCHIKECLLHLMFHILTFLEKKQDYVFNVHFKI